MSLTNVADVRQMLGMGEETGEDAILQRLILTADALIWRVTGKQFEARVDTTHVFHALNNVDGKILHLRTDLAATPTTVINGNGQAIASSEYVLLPVTDSPPYRHIVLKQGSSATWTYTGSPENAIQMTGRWGYSLLPPDDIRQAARSLVVWMYRRREQGGQDFDQATVSQSGVVLLPASWPLDVRLILEHYTPKAGAGSRVVKGRLIHA